MESNKAKRPFIPFTQAEIDKFWSKVDVRGRNECWEWQACRQKPVNNQLPYGWFARSMTVVGRREQIMAHRVSMMLHLNSPIPKDGNGKTLFVLHACHNPGCVNPNHLRLGTHDQNVADCVMAGRYKSADRRQKGGKRTYLTREQGAELLAQTDVPVSQLARRYGVSPHTIHRLRRKGMGPGFGAKVWRGGLSQIDPSRYGREQRLRRLARNAAQNPNLGI